MDYVTEYDRIIQEVSTVLKKPINRSQYEIIDRGVPHKPGSLKKGMMGVYTFIFQDQFLKIGIVGANSNPRFLSQHYNPKSAASTLAASLLADPEMERYGLDKILLVIGLNQIVVELIFLLIRISVCLLEI